MILFAELPFTFKPRLRQVVTIGMTMDSGARWGMFDHDGKFGTDLVLAVNTADGEPDEWAIRKASEFDGKKGSRCFDLSGYWCNVAYSIEERIATVQKTLSYLERPISRNDTFWADSEVGDTAQWQAEMRALSASGITGPARIVCQGIWDGRQDAPAIGPRAYPRSFGSCDGRTAYVPCFIEEEGWDPDAQLEWIAGVIKSARDYGYEILAHVRGGLGSSYNPQAPQPTWDLTQEYTQDQKCQYERIARLLRDLKVEVVMVFNTFGQGPTFTSDFDPEARKADDAATIRAFFC